MAAQVPTSNELLTPDDAVNILEEILEAQNQSYVLGLKLGLKPYAVEAIHTTHLLPRDRLLQVLIEFTKQVEPRPTWRAIVAALKNPVINSPQLAMKVEQAHSVNALEPSQPINFPADPESQEVVKVRTEIKVLKKRFNALKMSTVECLKNVGISVAKVVFIITSLCAVRHGDHKIFLEKNFERLNQSQDHWELFGSLNFYWSYLSYHLLKHLIVVVAHDKDEKIRLFFKDVKITMMEYKEDLQRFRMHTKLAHFCKAENTCITDQNDPPQDFRRVVVRHNFCPENVTLEDVEIFRQRYSSHYNLYNCAMIMNSITSGSLIVTWFIPLSVIEIVTKKRPAHIFSDFAVSRLEINGICVHKDFTFPHKSSEIGSTIVKSGKSEDISFLEQPSEDFFCPVTYGLLLQPHLTTCCGNHLSQEAATRIQGDGGACPLCKMPNLNTMLDKQFRRQVNELHVFCHHEERGCEWQGKLFDLESHVQSCPKKTSSDQSMHVDEEGLSQNNSADGVHQLPSTTCMITELPTSEQQESDSYTYHVSGPGLHSATANHQTYVELELINNHTKKLCLQMHRVTAELEYASEKTTTTVHTKYAHAYEVYYTARSQGQHKLHVYVFDTEIDGSPFTITVYPDPNQIAHLSEVKTRLDQPYGIAFNSKGEMVVSIRWSHQIFILDINQKKRAFGSRGDSPEQMNYPQGIAVDDSDNIYVTSWHKLQKFNSNGTKLKKWVGQEGSKEGEFDDPYGVIVHDDQVYVCDCHNHRIQVFGLDLNFIQSIGSHGKKEREFDAPFDVKFDKAGNMYVAEFNNRRVQVMNKNYDFVRVFGVEGKGKLHGPSSLHVADMYVYVSDWTGDCIVVYETSGQFVTSFGKYGHKEGEFRSPYSITSSAEGHIYVCDRDNGRIQIIQFHLPDCLPN